MSDEMEEIAVLYAGRRLVKPGKYGHAFLRPAQIAKFRADELERQEDGHPSFASTLTNRVEDAASIFTLSASQAPATVGATYTIKGKVNEQGRVVSIVPSSVRFTSRVPEAKIAEELGLATVWEQIDRDARQEIRTKTIEKNHVADRAAAEAIDTLKQRYRRTPSAYRRTFLFWLMAELEKQ